MNDMPNIELAETKPTTEGLPSATNIVKAVDATILTRLKNLVPEKARHVLRFSAQKAALTASSLYLMVSSGCGNIENPVIPFSNNEPSPTSSLLVPTPTENEVTVTIIRAPTSNPEPDTKGVTVTIIPAPTRTPESTPASTKAPEIPKYLESKIIDDMETYGDERSLTQEQLPKLYDKLNSAEQEMRNDTYYGTIFVSQTVYEGFRNTIKEDNFQKFLKKQEETFNSIVHLQPYPDTNKLSLRRLIVVEDIVETPHPYFLNYEKELIKDSDGAYRFQGSYLPHDSLKTPAYYDKDTGVDWGLLHEFGHSFFHIPDEYSLDFDIRNSSAVNPLEKIPLAWRSYFASYRSDIGKNLMGSPSSNRIGLYSNLQLLRRIEANDVHNNKKNPPEATMKFPYEIPQTVTFSFGKEYLNATVQIFRTVSTDPPNKQKKTLEPADTYMRLKNGELTLAKEKLFQPPQNENNLLESENATLLFQISKLGGELSYRWMDIRDFNIPYWQGYRDHVTMSFNLASEKDDPNTFDWTIKYSNGNPNTP